MPLTALWRRLDLPHALVHGAISELEPDPEHPYGGLLLDGAAVVDDEQEGTWSARYSVVTDEGWRTMSVFVEVLSADGLDRLELRADPLGIWTLDGRPWDELQGCFDADLSVTPLTNFLPIRRFGLAVGEETFTDTAWIDLPSLAVHRIRQTYRRLPAGPDDPDGAARYSYTDPTFGAFEILVDAGGLVLEYEALFTRVR